MSVLHFWPIPINYASFLLIFSVFPLFYFGYINLYAIDKPVPITWPQRGDITFENVTLRYENHKENIVANLNLVIPAGQRLGICGRSGSGKSTIAMSLFRVVDIVSGHIAIDDVNIATIHTDEIRTRLSVIPQCEKILFNGTIRENLGNSMWR